jgi:hypothetical protein
MLFSKFATLIYLLLFGMILLLFNQNYVRAEINKNIPVLPSSILFLPDPGIINVNSTVQRSIVFSSDGKLLAVNIKYKDGKEYKNKKNYEYESIKSARITLFTQSKKNWIFKTILKSPLYKSRTNLDNASIIFNNDSSLMAVGYSYINDKKISTNAVHIFNTNGELVQIINSPQTQNIGFGYHLAFSRDNSLAISFIHDNINGIAKAGSVFIYQTTDNQHWKQTQKMNAPLPGQSYEFGSELAFSPDGSTLAISEHEATVNNIKKTGQVHIFTQEMGRWIWSGIITAKILREFSNFGNSLAFSRTGYLAIGADRSNATVHIYYNDINNWKLKQVLISKSHPRSDSFGSSLMFSVNGNTLAIAEPSAHIPGNNEESPGIVGLYNLTDSKWRRFRLLNPQNPCTACAFGKSILFLGSTLVVSEALDQYPPTNVIANINLFENSD